MEIIFWCFWIQTVSDLSRLSCFYGHIGIQNFSASRDLCSLGIITSQIDNNLLFLMCRIYQNVWSHWATVSLVSRMPSSSLAVLATCWWRLCLGEVVYVLQQQQSRATAAPEPCVTYRSASIGTQVSLNPQEVLKTQHKVYADHHTCVKCVYWNPGFCIIVLQNVKI